MSSPLIGTLRVQMRFPTSVFPCRSNEPAGRRAAPPGKHPQANEIRGHLRRLVRSIRRHWPQIRITIRNDGHYGRPEVIEWWDENGGDFNFARPCNALLDRRAAKTAD